MAVSIPGIVFAAVNGVVVSENVNGYCVPMEGPDAGPVRGYESLFIHACKV